MQFATLFMMALASAELLLHAEDSKHATEAAAAAGSQAHDDEHVHNLHDALTDIHEDIDSTLDAGLEKPPSKKVNLLTKKAATKKFAGAVKMMLTLHKVMGPIHSKLSEALKIMKDGEAKEHTKALLTHVDALDGYSKKMSVLVAKLAEVEGGSKEEKDKAMFALMSGMMKFSVGIKKHMAALSALKAKHTSTAQLPIMGSGKLQAILHAMEGNLRTELKDPRLKSSKDFGKQVKFDLLMYMLVKKAVDESDALFSAAAAAYHKDPTDEVKAAVGEVVKHKMDEIQLKLKTSMKAIETALLTEKDDTHSSHVEAEATEKPAEEKAPETDEESDKPDEDAKEPTDDAAKETKASKDDDDDDDADDEEPKEGAAAAKAGDDKEDAPAKPAKKAEDTQGSLADVLGQIGAALPSKQALDDTQITSNDEAQVEDVAAQAHTATVSPGGETPF